MTQQTRTTAQTSPSPTILVDNADVLIFKTPSESEPGTSHSTTLYKRTGATFCTCKGYRGYKSCKHTKAAEGTYEAPRKRKQTKREPRAVVEAYDPYHSLTEMDDARHALHTQKLTVADVEDLALDEMLAERFDNDSVMGPSWTWGGSL